MQRQWSCSTGVASDVMSLDVAPAPKKYRQVLQSLFTLQYMKYSCIHTLHMQYISQEFMHADFAFINNVFTFNSCHSLPSKNASISLRFSCSVVKSYCTGVTNGALILHHTKKGSWYSVESYNHHLHSCCVGEFSVDKFHPLFCWELLCFRTLLQPVAEGTRNSPSKEGAETTGLGQHFPMDSWNDLKSPRFTKSNMSHRYSAWYTLLCSSLPDWHQPWRWQLHSPNLRWKSIFQLPSLKENSPLTNFACSLHANWYGCWTARFHVVFQCNGPRQLNKSFALQSIIPMLSM